MNVKTHIVPALVCTLGLSACSASNTAIKQVSNLQEGAQLPYAEGVLVGSLRWEQGEQGIAAHGSGRCQGPYTIIMLRNTASNELYRHLLEAPDFRLSLPPGQYVFEQILGGRLAVRVNSGSTETAAPWLLNVVTLPFGMMIIPSPGKNLRFKPALPPVVVREGEAAYGGSLIVDLPDPLPSEPFPVRVRTADEGSETLKEFDARFPGTIRVEKQLLISEH